MATDSTQIFADCVTTSGRFSTAEMGDLHRAGVRIVLVAESDTQLPSPDQPPRLVVLDHTVPFTDARNIVRAVRSRQPSRNIPVLRLGSAGVMDFDQFGPGETISEALTTEEVLSASQWGSSHFGNLSGVVRSLGDFPTDLTRDDSCEWLRTWLGILGVVRIDKGPQTLEQQIQSRVTGAYRLLDHLPDETLSFEDLWNVLLMVSVPWTEEEARATYRPLLQLPDDTTGSRKVILWKGASPVRHIAAFQPGTSFWSPVSGDPLREAVSGVALSDAEREALQILFKKRLLEGDLDALIHVLGKGDQQ